MDALSILYLKFKYMVLWCIIEIYIKTYGKPYRNIIRLKRKHILSTYSYYFLMLDLYNQNMNIDNLMNIIGSISPFYILRSYHTIQHVVIVD